MSDSFTESTNVSWFSRIKEAFGGLIIGLILFILSFPVLFWNEGRAVKTYKSLKEGAGAVIEIPADNVDPSNDGKLVHITGMATATGTVTDPDFGVSVPGAIKVIRTVEMYQWKEEKETRTRKKVGGGEERVTTYDYTKVWSKTPISSNNFHKSGYINPSNMPIRSETQQASTVLVGSFVLNSSQISQISGNEVLLLNKLPKSSPVSKPAHLYNGEIYYGTDPTIPQVGDCRVRFEKVLSHDVTVVAQQNGNSFVGYQTKAGDAISILENRVMSSSEVFEQAQAENKTFTWILRLVGFLMMLIGLLMLTKPLSVLADVIPFIGSIVGAGTFGISLLVSIAFSTATIAVAWVYYRPLIGVPLLLVSIGAFVVAIKQVAAKKK